MSESKHTITSLPRILPRLQHIGPALAAGTAVLPVAARNNCHHAIPQPCCCQICCQIQVHCCCFLLLPAFQPDTLLIHTCSTSGALLLATASPALLLATASTALLLQSASAAPAILLLVQVAVVVPVQLLLCLPGQHPRIPGG